MTAAIEIEGLSKSYKTDEGKVRAVESLNLVIEPGEVFGFLGPNGAGKTTTVQMLMGVVFPTSGTAHILGKPLGDIEVRSYIGYLPESFRGYSFMRAEDLLDFYASLYGIPSKEREARIAEVLQIIGMEENRRSRLRTFSKGMLQRIGIAQSLINHPKVLFLDEPTSSLDPMGRREVRNLVLRLRESGTTVFLNSHMLSEVEMTCSRIGILNKGKLIKVSDIGSLTKPEHEVEIRAEGIDDDAMAKIKEMAKSVVQEDGMLVVCLEQEEMIRELARIITDSGAVLTGFTPRQVPLEEAFMQVIAESNA